MLSGSVPVKLLLPARTQQKQCLKMFWAVFATKRKAMPIAMLVLLFLSSLQH